MFRLDLFGYIIEMKSLKWWILQIRYRTKRKYLPVSYWLQLTKSGPFSFWPFDVCLLLKENSTLILVSCTPSIRGRSPALWGPARRWKEPRVAEDFLSSETAWPHFSTGSHLRRGLGWAHFLGWDRLKLNLALYDAYCVLYQTYILVQVLTDILWIIT